ncbi:MAG TPA: translation initiation factor IF-2 [Kofleriaceae bacterium]
MRVYEIAKEVGIPNKDLIAKIRALGLEVNNHMSSLDADDVARIKRSLEREKGVQQPQEVKKIATGAGAPVIRRRSAGDKAEGADEAGTRAAAPAPAAPSAPAAVVRRRAEADSVASSSTHAPAAPTPRAAAPVAPPVRETHAEAVTPGHRAVAPIHSPAEAIRPTAEAAQPTPARHEDVTPPARDHRVEDAAPARETPAAAPVRETHAAPTHAAPAPVAPTPAPASVAAAPVEAPIATPIATSIAAGSAPIAAPAREVHATPAPIAVVPTPAPAPVRTAPTPVAPAPAPAPVRETPVAPTQAARPAAPAAPAPQQQDNRPRSRVIVPGPQIVGGNGNGSGPIIERRQGTRIVQPLPQQPEPPPSTPLPRRVVEPRGNYQTQSPPTSPLPVNAESARSRFELELERARARTESRPEPVAPRVVEVAPPPPVAAPPTRDPSRPAVGSVIALPPRIKITERAPMGGRPAPGPQPVNPIRGRFAQQQQQRGRPGGPGGRPGQNDFGRKKLPLNKKGKQTQLTTPAEHKRVIRIEDTITVSDLARNMGIKAPEVLKKLWGMGMTGVTINTAIDFDTAQILASEFGYEVQNVAFKEEDIFSVKVDADEHLLPRSPVVTIMGHVDHGKTSLLDAIRKTRVAAGEAGGITQHIAAYKVTAPGHGDIVFLDTPGHEAFTEMRARGAQATDIVVLVVAANDGVMPQTLEALAHAKDAKVTIIVAVNKIDTPDAQPDRVRQQLADKGLIPEEWGGDTIYVNVSALRGENIDKLLESIAISAEVLELKANPDKPASGLVIEARLDRNRGPMATVLIQEGTLRVGDMVVAGRTFGKVRAMLDDLGRSVEEAGPSTPIEVLGLDGVPDAGDQVNGAEDDKVAKQVVEHRRQQERKRELGSKQRFSLENLMERNSENATKELKIVLKADVQGSAEALKTSLTKLTTEKVRVHVIAAGVGGITESDVNLAKAGGAIIVGFHVRPAGKSSKLAEQEEVEIRLYDIIYDALDDVKSAMAGLLAPIKREVAMGKLNVRETFSIPKMGAVAGCMVVEGKITRKAHLRIIRDAVQVYEGKVASLRRFKDDVSEVQQGYECGVMVAGWNEIKQNDVIEAYEVIEEAAQL